VPFHSYDVERNTIMLRYGSVLGSHGKMSILTCITDSSLHQCEVYLRRARTLLASLLNDPRGFWAHSGVRDHVWHFIKYIEA
jgi:hypothetical protein